MKINKQFILKYSKLYDIENLLFEEIGPIARKRGYLKYDEFIKICMWKTPRPKRLYQRNGPKKVEMQTKLAFSNPNEVGKIRCLTELWGVYIPVASAILTVVFPEKYGIIDTKSINSLKELGICTDIGKNSRKDWLKYLNVIRKIAKRNELNVRIVDQFLFAFDREKRSWSLNDV
ncbi:hypothetical protein HYU14_05195 [Candidatus Woesearchaeota archaeon]|nr:hypothetical protein [Candidatus Woesearchaeota archaeon]